MVIKILNINAQSAVQVKRKRTGTQKQQERERCNFDFDSRDTQMIHVPFYKKPQPVKYFKVKPVLTSGP